MRLSDIDQPTVMSGCYADCMTIVRHYPETLPESTETAFPGYPLGVWPPMISSFCNENATWEPRHSDCSLPGCTVPMPLQARDECQAAINEFFRCQ
jgi:hypothetical protein